MSTLRLDNVSPSAGGTTYDLHDATMKSTLHYNGTTNTINASYNVASITDLGTGFTQVDFTNNMANQLYNYTGGGQYDEININEDVPRFGIYRRANAQLTNQFDMICTSGSSGEDALVQTFMTIGELA